jgi:hypothetical protein
LLPRTTTATPSRSSTSSGPSTENRMSATLLLLFRQLPWRETVPPQ